MTNRHNWLCLFVKLWFGRHLLGLYQLLWNMFKNSFYRQNNMYEPRDK